MIISFRGKTEDHTWPVQTWSDLAWTSDNLFFSSFFSYFIHSFRDILDAGFETDEESASGADHLLDPATNIPVSHDAQAKRVRVECQNEILTPSRVYVYMTQRKEGK